MLKYNFELVIVDSKSPVVTLKSFSNEPSSILNTPNLARMIHYLLVGYIRTTYINF